ncbi:DnaB domain protein helicase, C-terminal domain protein [Thermosinus carboxydivorans Nor1]|uniref:DNA 5'-3' helicase n=1 Tax=Thermosinus carboxydivorans Nor1 TaxID=401526 RepID=A1HR39_9FIRM|nr:replicative DNA helicase [Thermosinus carboxydivorans]EAX47540.1 DnaB domain protein helicase, C-terminal domain protein [Thermosinus carboxydivorans Nor1]
MSVDLELEAQVLAAMLNDNECLDSGMALVKKEYFAEPFHRTVFDHVQAMYSAGKHIDAITVYEEIKDIAKGRGVSWMTLKDAFFSSATFEYCVNKLADLYRARRLADLAQKTLKRIQQKDEPEDILKDVEGELYAITMQTSEIKILTPQDHARRMFETLSKRLEKRSNGGICTSYVRLNYATNGGFLPGQLIIIAAQTGKGKTAFAMNLMRDIAIQQKQPALYINTEMSEEQMDCRWMAMLTPEPELTHTKIASGQLTDEESLSVVRALDKMNNSGFYSTTIPDLTLTTLVSTARRFKSRTGMKVLVVDYVGRMDTSDPKLQEWQVYKQIAKRLKTLAQELQITVIMLAQITEDEKLEGARGMKNECDLFACLREMTPDESLSFLQSYNYFLVLDKNRDGRRIKIPLRFIGEKLTFEGETIDEVVRSQQKQGENRSAPEVAAETGGGRGRRQAGSRKMPQADWAR